VRVETVTVFVVLAGYDTVHGQFVIVRVVDPVAV
jgi:hypothetical protein